MTASTFYLYLMAFLSTMSFVFFMARYKVLAFFYFITTAVLAILWVGLFLLYYDAVPEGSDTLTGILDYWFEVSIVFENFINKVGLNESSNYNSYLIPNFYAFISIGFLVGYVYLFYELIRVIRKQWFQQDNTIDHSAQILVLSIVFIFLISVYWGVRPFFIEKNNITELSLANSVKSIYGTIESYAVGIVLPLSVIFFSGKSFSKKKAMLYILFTSTPFVFGFLINVVTGEMGKIVEFKKLIEFISHIIFYLFWYILLYKDGRILQTVALLLFTFLVRFIAFGTTYFFFFK